ncbi:hypothetical protein LWC33_05600 [Pseudonocardia sp. RS11V-5]|uniref:hypothetical protein n=1 Tax=Pseudonocardia terrae TaxID=2905831 RepID=UPI001E57C6D1|nr:hypothetical protein [Pseudonocardia terrae]MCE3550931.1 hypothetical protein [Pseudonocardia terrae]
MIRALRAVAGVLVLVLATLLMVVGLVLCLTVVLLPVGLGVGFLAVKLGKAGVRLLLPRKVDVQRGLQGSLRVPEIRAAADRFARSTRRPRRRLRKRVRRARRRLGKRLSS